MAECERNLLIRARCKEMLIRKGSPVQQVKEDWSGAARLRELVIKRSGGIRKTLFS
jgi:hypothetical protein